MKLFGKRIVIKGSRKQVEKCYKENKRKSDDCKECKFDNLCIKIARRLEEDG